MALTRAATVAGIVLIAIAAPARGDDEARTHYQRAEAAFALSEFAEAAREYEAALRIKPQPPLLFNAAQSHRLAGNRARALQLYVNYVRIYGDRVSNREDVEAMIVKLRQALATAAAAKPTPPTEGPSSVAEPPPAAASRDVDRPVPAPAVAPEPSAPAPEPARPAATSEPSSVPLVPPPAATPRPLVRQPLFWGVLAASAVAAVCLGLVIALVASPRDPAPSLGTFTFGGR